MTEEVVLLDEDGRAVGTFDKLAVHHHETPLHLAFSCYVFNARGEFLLTRRAWHKPTWPGVWTNSCCGHPLPGEDLRASVARRLSDELGLTARRIELILPAFRYRARMGNGIVENEMCPVFATITDEEPVPAAAEVAETSWTPWDRFAAAVAAGATAISPWSVLQVAALAAAGPDPLAWAPASPAALPPAARPPAARQPGTLRACP
jgi:isopentenyl-diphosphate delta-isomerase